MGKVLAIALAAAVVFFVVHSRGANAAKVTSCLSHAGAVVRQSTFFEDHFSMTSAARQENSDLREKIRKADKNLWNVQLHDDTGLLIKVGSGYSAKDVREKVGGTVQGSGRIVMLWSGAPTDASRQAVERCLH
jgi:hypothetical protein